MSHDRRHATEENEHDAHEREEWAHSRDREHQWEAREHARLHTRAGRRSLGNGADAQQGKHQKHHE